jgi:hypothetical protein
MRQQGGSSVYVGHFVPAEILHDLFPKTPRWVALTGVSFPDLLWGGTVLAGVEKVELNPDSPLQKYIKFIKFPFSHSLVLGTLLACIPGVLLGIFVGWSAGIVFVLASASHWILDTIVHLPDLPILGFDGDRKVGLGLWRHGRIAWIFEYGFYAIGTLLFVPQSSWGYMLIAGFALNLLNVNSAFGFTKTNPLKSPRLFAIVTLVGFGAGIYLFNNTI